VHIDASRRIDITSPEKVELNGPHIHAWRRSVDASQPS